MTSPLLAVLYIMIFFQHIRIQKTFKPRALLEMEPPQIMKLFVDTPWARQRFDGKNTTWNKPCHRRY